MGKVYIEDQANDLKLREPEEKDMELMREMLNDPHIEYSVTGWGLPISQYQQNKWFSEIYPNNASTLYLIMEKSGTAVGCFVLGDYDQENRSASLGIKILKQYQGTRMTVQLVQLLVRYCFEILHLHCLYGYCLALQKATLRLVRMFKFKQEGVQRSACYKHGRRWDIVYFSRLEDEYWELNKK